MCDRFAEQDSRVRVVHKENGGVSSARNAGLAAVRGNWIAFVDSDDCITPDFCEKLYTAVNAQNADCAMCSMKVVDKEKPLFGDEGWRKVSDESLSGREVLKKWAETKKSVYLMSAGKLFCRNLFDTLRYPEGKLNEDAFVFAPLVDSAQKVVCISEELYSYRQHEESIMNQAKSIRSLNETAAFVYCFEYFETHGMLELLAPTEKQIFGKLTNVYYALPKDAQRSEEAKAAKKMQRDAVKKLWQYHLLSGRTLFRTVLFQLFPDIYGLRKQAYRLNVEKISEGV